MKESWELAEDFWRIEMNEKIKELKAKATIIVGVEQGLAFDREVLDEEKFAELIVRECIGLFVDPYQTYTGVYIEAKIEEHFGVEEQEKVVPRHKCSVCGTTENVRWVGGYLPYLCDDVDCIPF